MADAGAQGTAICVIAVCLGMGFQTAVDAQTTSHAKQRKGSVLYYPQQVNVPKDIPSVSVVVPKAPSEREQVIIPPAIYLESHYDGWQAFLGLYISTGEDSLNRKWEPPIIQIGEPYTFRGIEDGYHDCRMHVRQLLTSSDAQHVLDWVRKAYRPRKTFPPPRD